MEHRRGGGSTSTPSSSSSLPAPSQHPAQQIRIGKRFRLVRRLGGGAFGEVYVGIDSVTEEQVAIKLEPVAASHQPHLQHEARLYQLLSKGVVTVGFPRLRYFGREGEFNAMVMDLLGPSLEDLYDHCGRKFNIKTTCMLGIQMIHRLEFLHAMGFLHRDLKPENFVMGLGRRAHHLYLIDMGLAKRYRDPKTHEHIPFIEGKALTGTARYVSISTHIGYQQARRDDLESVALILIYFAAGGLPWQGVRAVTKLQKYEQIKKMKMETSVEQSCKEISCPQPFQDFLQYARDLEFTAAPDYSGCVRRLEHLMDELSFECDYSFQWLDQSNAQQETQLHPTVGGNEQELSANTGGNVTSPRLGESTMTNGSSIFASPTQLVNSRFLKRRTNAAPSSPITKDPVPSNGADDVVGSPRTTAGEVTAHALAAELV